MSKICMCSGGVPTLAEGHSDGIWICKKCGAGEYNPTNIKNLTAADFKLAVVEDYISTFLPMLKKVARIAYVEGFNKGYDCYDAVEAHEASVSEETAEMCFEKWARLFFKGV